MLALMCFSQSCIVLFIFTNVCSWAGWNVQQVNGPTRGEQKRRRGDSTDRLSQAKRLIECEKALLKLLIWGEQHSRQSWQSDFIKIHEMFEMLPMSLSLSSISVFLNVFTQPLLFLYHTLSFSSPLPLQKNSLYALQIIFLPQQLINLGTDYRHSRLGYQTRKSTAIYFCSEGAVYIMCEH